MQQIVYSTIQHAIEFFYCAYRSNLFLVKTLCCTSWISRFSHPLGYIKLNTNEVMIVLRIIMAFQGCKVSLKTIFLGNWLIDYSMNIVIYSVVWQSYGLSKRAYNLLRWDVHIFLKVDSLIAYKLLTMYGSIIISPCFTTLVSDCIIAGNM
jgi:hypothetical protein